MKSNKVFLIGTILTQKLVNKENFKRQMRNLWRPKTNVLIFKLENDRFAFGFNSRQERSMVKRGSPWLYNKQTLLVLEKADDVTCPTIVALKFLRILGANQRAFFLLHDETDGLIPRKFVW